jgi:hypothetical protein
MTHLQCPTPAAAAAAAVWLVPLLPYLHLLLHWLLLPLACCLAAPLQHQTVCYCCLLLLLLPAR